MSRTTRDAQGRKVGLGAFDLRAIGIDGRADARLVERLLEHEFRFLLLLAQQVDRLVAHARETRGLTARDEHLVERGVHRVQQVADRELDRAAAVRTGVARREIQDRQIPRSGLVERCEALFDRGTARAQFEVRGQCFVEQRLQAFFHRACAAQAVAASRPIGQR